MKRPPAAASARDVVLPDGKRCRVEAVSLRDAGRRREVEVFFRALREERTYLRTRLEEVWRARAVALARVDDAVVGLTGIVRRVWGIPCRFIIVKAERQRQGIARRLYEASQPGSRRYLFVLSIVLSGNVAAKSFFPRAGETMLFEEDRFAFFVRSPRPWFRRLYPLLGGVLPAILKLRDATAGLFGRGE